MFNITDMEESTADFIPHSDKCYICLSPFDKRAVASLESCQHVFCLECILQWSQVNLHFTWHSQYVRYF
uniref:RING-type domain-containing protein n=1 Tax=Dicentrarchus labrax TaxID=13489 RepID=A0A8C4H8B0_DICLA